MVFDSDRSFLSQKGRKASAFTLASELKRLELPAPPTHTPHLQPEGLCTDPALPPGTLTLSTELRTTSSVQSMLHAGEVEDTLLKRNLENQTPVCLVFPPAPPFGALRLFTLLENTLHQNPTGKLTVEL